MIRNLIISLLILHGMYIVISNSFIVNHRIRILDKENPLIAISESNQLLQEGDMVFRLNKDGLSQLIKSFNRQDKQYSHAGVVIMEDENPIIYHMVNGEGNNSNVMVKSSFAEFVNPKRNYAFGIYRNEINEKEKLSIATQIKQWYSKRMEFDFEFNLQTDDKMYCSEMIAKAIIKATNKRIKINGTKFSSKEAIAFAAYSKLPLDFIKNLEVVAIDNLYQHKWCNVVKEYTFKN